MKTKQLCLALVKCESEIEVIELLKKENLWNTTSNWQYFGGEENNYSIIGNQQSKPETALVEKIVNSVDAMLMGRCQQQNIKPEDKNAPKSIKEGLEKYFNIYDGKLTSLSSRERSLLSENIGIIATGQKTNPNYIIFDKGEGQTPARMKDTILSIRKSNKLRVQFVQGKFNMGGTGVFRFCGDRNIQVILSKRDPKISQFEDDDTKDKWGITVIRRDDPIEGARSSNYKYLAPDGNILSFDADELPVLPGSYPNAYGKPMQWGTYIKFFEYNIGPGLRTNIAFDLYNKLSTLMPQLALPVKLYERRNNYTGNSFETVLSGLSVRVDEDRSNNIEQGFPISGKITVSGQKMKYSIYVFKKGKHEKFTNEEGILFIINGQTHGYLSKAFFNRKSVGLNYLSDSILVLLDCSEIEGRERENLFMNSRDRLSTCPLKTEIENELADIFKKHPGLRALKEKRRREEIETKLNDQKPLKEVLKDFLKKSPTLSKLFVEGVGINNPFKLTGAEKLETYFGNEFPNFFTLSKKYPQNSPKNAHLSSKFRMEYKTDVSNDYFDRSKNPGTFKLFINGVESSNKDINLWNGYAYLSVNINNYAIGEVLYLKSEIEDVSMSMPITEEWYVKVIEPITKEETKSGTRKNPASDKAGNDTKKDSGFNLPTITEVSKDKRTGHSWEDHDFNEYSALRVKGNEIDGYDFFINIDNIYLLSELKNAKGNSIETTQMKFKFGQVLLGLAILNEYQIKSGEQEDTYCDNIETIIEKVSKSISPVIIPLIDNLKDIDLNEMTQNVLEEVN
jgi:hypothetical protein